MDEDRVGRVLENLDRRMTRVEQILPTLPTREDVRIAIADATAPLASKVQLDAAVARLATKEELEAAVARLATREELEAAVARLATREELAAAIAPLATRAEVGEEGERTRRHFDVVAESLRDDIRIIAEGQVSLSHRFDEFRVEFKADIASLDRRVTRLEASQPQSRRRR